MTIQVLPPRLANQIAAGEVVERPSSVVKELIENSIDAGATRIDIDIEKGGAKLIRIRDNGSGVEKDQLGLALSRHATSKLASLDDLEAISSLGFRGEALASISSVSRLTFTSRPKSQEQAWQAYAEGRDMQVQVKPAAHPIGTTVEVIDLFFNTPARRKFLRTDKTEFNHIDELIKRIALSRFDLQITLKHNGKVIRSYRPASTVEQQERRVAQVTSNQFMMNCMALSCEHSDIKLWGWVGLPRDNAVQDTQYSYVNGRMMRDKLINHALRQAYEEATGITAPPAYVLFIEVSIKDVDVNVHPAKHEVRFHHARLVHDFIFQAVFKALSEGTNPSTMQDAALPIAEDIEYPGQQNSQHTPNGVARHDYGTMVSSSLAYTTNADVVNESGDHEYQVASSRASSFAGQYRAEQPSKQEVSAYQQLLTPAQSIEKESSHTPVESAKAQLSERSQPQLRAHSNKVKLLTVLSERFLLIESNGELQLLDLLACWRENCKQQLLQAWQQGIISQPLLLPIAIKLDKNLVEIAKNQQKLLVRLGLELNYSTNATIIVKKVPAQLRQANLPVVLPELLQQLIHLNQKAALEDITPLCHWLAIQGSQGLTEFTWEQANQIYSQFTELADTVQLQVSASLFRKLDHMPVIERFNCEPKTE